MCIQIIILVIFPLPRAQLEKKKKKVTSQHVFLRAAGQTGLDESRPWQQNTSQSERRERSLGEIRLAGPVIAGRLFDTYTSVRVCCMNDDYRGEFGRM